MARYSIADNNENDPNPFPAIGQFALHSRGQSAGNRLDAHLQSALAERSARLLLPQLFSFRHRASEYRYQRHGRDSRL